MAVTSNSFAVGNTNAIEPTQSIDEQFLLCHDRLANFQAPAQQALHLRVVGLRMLVTDTFTRDLMQVRCERQPLFAGHLAIERDLKVKRGLWVIRKVERAVD